MLFISRSGIYARQTLTNKNVGHKYPIYLGFAKVSGCVNRWIDAFMSYVPNIAENKKNGTFLWAHCIKNRAAWLHCGSSVAPFVHW